MPKYAYSLLILIAAGWLGSACGGGQLPPVAVTQLPGGLPPPTAAGDQTAVIPSATPAAPPAEVTSPPPAEDSPPPTVVPDLPPETSAGLPVIALELFEDAFGGVEVIGEIHNDSGSYVSNLKLAITLFDADNAPIFTYEDLSPHLSNLAPGQVSSFNYTPLESVSATSVGAEVTSFEITNLSAAPLELSSTRLLTDDFGGVYCTGELSNIGAQPARLSSIAAQVLDTSGQVLGADTSPVHTGALLPNGFTPFRISVGVLKPGLAPSHCNILYDSTVHALADSTANGLTTSGNQLYLDDFGSPHLIGELHNSSPAAASVRLVAGLYAIDGTVLDATALDLPLLALPSGGVHPFNFDLFDVVSYTSGLYAQVSDAKVVIDPYGSAASPYQVADMTLDSHSFFDDGTSWTYTGLATNPSDAILDSALAYLRVYDGSGALAAYSYQQIPGELLPGSQIEFNILLWRPQQANPGDYRYEIQVVGFYQ